MSKTGFREYQSGDTVRGESRTYVVEERLAHGPFGYAYACRDEWGRDLVLEVVWPFTRPYRNVREKWQQQAVELRRLQHPNLVHVYDSFEHGGSFHLVVERCDHPLEGYVLSPAWSGPRWFKAVAAAVLGGLDHIHRAGLVHRNLHPRNILCSVALERFHPAALPPGAIKISDLASNHLIGNVDLMNMRIAKWLTPPEYLNPSRHGLMDHRVDVYQAGLLLLAVLLGRVPRFSFEEIAVGLPGKTAAELQSSFGKVLARALQLDVEDRFPDALAFWQELAGARQPTPAAAG
jgi:eukaryotic-like serine/threonine-protein kinase